MSLLPRPAGEPLRDFLEQPAVAVGVAEGGVAQVGAAFRIQARRRWLARRAVERLADVDTAADQVLARGRDIGDHELQALSRARLSCGHALPERDRALRVRRR